MLRHFMYHYESQSIMVYTSMKPLCMCLVSFKVGGWEAVNILKAYLLHVLMWATKHVRQWKWPRQMNEWLRQQG